MTMTMLILLTAISCLLKFLDTHYGSCKMYVDCYFVQQPNYTMPSSITWFVEMNRIIREENIAVVLLIS